jgi:hypothetical protein
MKPSSYQAREAKRINLSGAITHARDEDYQRRAREIRRENIRRTAAAARVQS